MHVVLSILIMSDTGEEIFAQCRMDASSLQGNIYMQGVYITIDFRWSIHKSPTGVIAHVQYRS